MATSKATTVKQYLRELPADRREVIEAVRAVINKNLPKGLEEGMQYGMIGWFVPHSIYPDGYHCDPKQPLPYVSLANQKNHMAVYMFCLYGEQAAAAEFERQWKASGIKLDMGKSCVRFKKLEGVCLDAIGDAVKAMPLKRYIEVYESNVKSPSGRTGRLGSGTTQATRKKAAKKRATKKTAAKRVSKNTTARKTTATKATAKKAVTKKTSKKKVTKKAAAKKTARRSPRRAAG